jgi:hypothetical protein
LAKKLPKNDNDNSLKELHMQDVVCRRFCSYYKLQKNEPEKCLAFELLSAWKTWAPDLPAALAAMPERSIVVFGGAASPAESGGNDDCGAAGSQRRDRQHCGSADE